jgi:L-arabinose isomerase
MKVERMRPLAANVGILGVGHHTYWPQFQGLLDELKGKMTRFERKVEASGVTVSTFGIADNAASAYKVVPAIKAADLDLLFIDMLTYATSSTFGVIAREITAPIVLVALQPLSAMDYPNSSTYIQLVNDDICSLPEFAGVAVRLGRPMPNMVIGMLEGDAAADREIATWCQVARVLHDLRRARIGLMGHVLEAMLDMHADPTALTAAFGCHIVLTEPDDLMKHYRTVENSAIKKTEAMILDFFDTPDPKSDPITRKLTAEHLQIAARVAVALERFVVEKDLQGLAYYYEAEEGTEMRTLVTNLIVGNSLLTAAGFPMCGEYDIKTCVAMMIMDRLDIGGSFAEFHPVDFKKGSVLVGHDGPHHLNIADRKPLLRSLVKYHGKPGTGAGVEFNIKEGPITMLSISSTFEGKFKFVIAEGESVHGPIPPTGNTNTHGYFKPDIRTFLKKWLAEGPTHHFALGIGHHGQTIKTIGELLGIESVLVTQE